MNENKPKMRFKGRVIISAGDNIRGKVLKSSNGFNPLASYKNALMKGDKKGICSDQNNTELYGKELAGAILCTSQFFGSTTGGVVLSTAIDRKINPKAILFSNQIDSLAASGIILSSIWQKQNIICVDSLGDDFLNQIEQDMEIEIDKEGNIFVY